jgi:hypothetical protein
MDDAPITAEECRERAANCASAADRTSNEYVRQLLESMEKMWLKLATETERLATARRLAMQTSSAGADGSERGTHDCGAASC